MLILLCTILYISLLKVTMFSLNVCVFFFLFMFLQKLNVSCILHSSPWYSLYQLYLLWTWQSGLFDTAQTIYSEIKKCRLHIECSSHTHRSSLLSQPEVSFQSEYGLLFPATKIPFKMHKCHTVTAKTRKEFPGIAWLQRRQWTTLTFSDALYG